MRKTKKKRQPVAKPRIHKGDTVMVCKGKDRGQTGEVLKVLPEEARVLVQGINKKFRHMKPSQKDPHGGRVEKEFPMPLANLMVVGSDNTPSRVGIRINEDGTRVRYLKKTGEELK
jgi:large subunit ribosomal protein L24